MSVRVLEGDVLDRLAELPDESVQCVVTSPPYWGLRDYGTAQWEGGDPECAHEAPPEWIESRFTGKSGLTGTETQAEAAKTRWFNPDGSCPCGATRIDTQIGLEPTFEAHLKVLANVFREVRRVLRKDGSLWLNYGDAYTSGGRASQVGQGGKVTSQVMHDLPRPATPAGLKPKDLMMMPARVAMALQADGWWLRSEIIWHKPNPMPESVTDRPTNSHEKLFLLTRSKRYFYDAEAVRVPINPNRAVKAVINGGGVSVRPPGKGADKNDLRAGSWKESRTTAEMAERGANLRNVWTIPTHAYSEAHFATFPTALVEPCIKAGTSETGCCGDCGAPWVRGIKAESRPNQSDNAGKHDGSLYRTVSGGVWKDARRKTDIGWKPSCACKSVLDLTPCTVLDPFGGSGTVGLVADRLGRDAILIELNPEYAQMARERIVGDAPLFADVK